MQPDDSDKMACVYLPTHWFALCWCSVNLLRGLHIAFLVAVTYLYLWILRSEDHLQNTLDNLTFAVSYSTLGILIWFFTLVAGLQLGMVLRSCWFALNSTQSTRTAAMSEPITSPANEEVASGLLFTKVSAIADASTAAKGTTRAKSPSQKFGGALDKAWTSFKLQWLEPFFFIRGKHYDHFFLAREYLEVAVQVYQAYQMSIFAASRRLNNLFVLMILVNCISSPLIHVLVPSSNVPLRRVLNLTFSALLNFINSVVIPVVLFMPYVHAFDTTLGYFPDKYFMDDVWYAQAVRENELLFVTSYVDFVTTWIPQWSLFSCLWTFESLARCQVGQESSEVVPFESFNETNTIEPTTKQHQDTSNRTKSDLRKSENVMVLLLKSMRYHVLWITGLVVLAIHIAAQSPGAIAGCRLLSTPWFETKFSCVIMNLNCERREIDGTTQQLHDVLVLLATNSLFQLSISHCPKLHVPAILQRFNRLEGIDLYNCTLFEWSSDAALTQQFHPVLDFVWLLRTNLSSIPDGLISSNFPSSVHVVAFYEVNLTMLPDTLDQRWTSLRTFQCELCPLTAYPSVLARMGTPQISLTGAPSIQAIDSPDLFLNGSLRAFWMANSSLQSLPNKITGTLDQLMYLTLQFSQVPQVPPYLIEWERAKSDANAYYSASLFGTPYCNHALMALPQNPQQDTQEQAFQRRLCVFNPWLIYALDIDLVASQRVA